MPPDVVLVSTYPQPGRIHAGHSGVSSYAAQLARALTREGADVMVMAPVSSGSPGRYTEEGVTIVRSFSPGPVGPVRAIRAAQRLEARVVHLQHETFLFGGVVSLPGLPATMASLRRTGAAGVVTMHQVVDRHRIDGEFLRLHRMDVPVSFARAGMGLVQRCLVGGADAVVVHEESFAEILPGTTVIPHGVETGSTPGREEARRLLGLDHEHRLVVLCFGFLAPYKGLELALEAASGLPEVRLVVAGGPHPRLGSYAGELRRRWGSVADFVGHVSDAAVPLWHAAADLALFCHPAPHSASGPFALALGHGLPFLAGEPLARTTGAPRELSFRLDAVDLGDRLRRLASRRDLLQEMSRAARRMAAGRSWPEVARRHLELYDGLGQAGGGPGVVPVNESSLPGSVQVSDG